MKKWFEWGITRQYVTFFLLASVIPVTVLSFLFISTSNDKLNERMINQLELGTALAQNIYQSELKRLELASRQAAMFSLDDEFTEATIGGNKIPLQSFLDQYKELRQLEIVEVFNNPQSILASSQSVDPLQSNGHIQMIREAFSGQTVSGFTTLRDMKTGETYIVLLCATPITSPTSPEKVKGVLLTGRTLNSESSFRQLLATIPSLDLRIALKMDDGTYSILSSSERLRDGGSLTLAIHSDGIIEETIGGASFKSKSSPLTDREGNIIGHVVVSTSEADFADLREKNLQYVLIYFVITLIFTIATAYWFRKVFVKPVDVLAQVSGKVAEGDLTVRLEDSGQTAPEISHVFRSFNQMLKQLEETDTLRNTFVSALTHDLRTPVTAQKRVLETLDRMKDRLDPEIAAITTGLLRNNEQLLETINKLLEASQYEAGSIHLHPEMVSIPKLAQECYDEIRPLAEARHIELVNEISPDFPPILADGSQLRRVFINLLSNAVDNIGYNKQIIISGEVRKSSVLLCVTDNGPGIPAEVLPKLFNRFSTGYKRQKIGSGLGLFICRMIVELHGGSISVQSEPGKGARFMIILPRLQFIREPLPKEKNQHV